MADRETQAGTLALHLGGEEGFEYPLQQERFDPAAVVVHVQFDPARFAAGHLLQANAPAGQAKIAEQSIAGVGEQVDDHLFQLVRLPSYHHPLRRRRALHLDGVLTQPLAEQAQGAFEGGIGVERQRLQRRLAAEHAEVTDQAVDAQDLGIHALQFLAQVVAVEADAVHPLAHVEEGHAQHVQRLLHLVGEAADHLPQAGHLGALRQLLLGPTHRRVVASHRLYLAQFAPGVEQRSLGPHQPEKTLPRQVEAQFRHLAGALPRRNQQTRAQGAGVFRRQPLVEPATDQALRAGREAIGEGPVHVGQHQVGGIATDQRRRILHQDPVAFLALGDTLCRQVLLGHVQPQAHRLAGQALGIAQQLGFVVEPVPVALAIGEAIAGLHPALAKQLAAAGEKGLQIIRMHPLGERLPTLSLQVEAEQVARAFAVELRHQVPLLDPLDIDHHRRTVDQAAQPRVGRLCPFLLAPAFADVEQHAGQPQGTAAPQRPALDAQPAALAAAIRLTQAKVLGQRLAAAQAGTQAQAELVGVRRLQQALQVFQRHPTILAGQPQAIVQGRRQFEEFLLRPVTPPAAADHLLQQPQLARTVVLLVEFAAVRHLVRQQFREVLPVLRRGPLGELLQRHRPHQQCPQAATAHRRRHQVERVLADLPEQRRGAFATA